MQRQRMHWLCFHHSFLKLIKFVARDTRRIKLLLLLWPNFTLNVLLHFYKVPGGFQTKEITIPNVEVRDLDILDLCLASDFSVGSDVAPNIRLDIDHRYCVALELAATNAMV